MVKEGALQNGAFDAVVCTHWAEGGLGAITLADSVMKACDQASKFRFLYDLNSSLEEKILQISKEMYGAGNVELLPAVQEKLKKYTEQGYGKLPICMAKTQNSLTGDPNIKGAPTGFTLKINDVTISVGAGFVIPIVGEVNITCSYNNLRIL